MRTLKALAVVRRFGRDLVVIILGVLVALAFDSWRDGPTIASWQASTYRTLAVLRER